MTLIVWVGNKNALAFAADSVWSVQHKTFIVNKLFEVSNNDPVWVAIAWCSDFRNILNETIIKEFRKEIYNDRCDTLEEYVDLFLNYLKNSEYISYWTEEDTIKSIIIWFHKILQGHIKDHINQLYESDNFSNKSMEEQKEIIMKSWINLVSEQLKLILQVLSSQKTRRKLEWLNKFSYNELKKLVNRDENLLSSMFCNPWTENYKLFLKIIKLSLWNDNFLRTSWTLYNKFKNCIMYSKDELKTLDYWFIQPYAQWEDVLTSIFWIWNQTATRIMDLVSNSLKKDKELNKLWKKKLFNIEKIVIDSINNVRKESISPLITAVTLLSKAELWSVAERFVWIWSMKKRVNMWYETIWWPIDVAVVTKSDWFIWIKRKYYFDEKLNYNYFNKLCTNHDEIYKNKSS